MADPFKQKEKSIERAETITGLAREVLNKKKKSNFPEKNLFLLLCFVLLFFSLAFYFH